MLLTSLKRYLQNYQKYCLFQSPLNSTMGTEDFWRKFSEEGFKQKPISEDPTSLIEPYSYSDLLSDEVSTPKSAGEDRPAKQELGEIRRSKSVGPELSPLCTKPPVESKDAEESISSDRAKSSGSKPKKTKSRLKTWGRIKGIKGMKALNRMGKKASLRNIDIDINAETPIQPLSDMAEVSSGETAQTQSVPISPTTKFGEFSGFIHCYLFNGLIVKRFIPINENNNITK